MNYEKLWKELKKTINESVHPQWLDIEILELMDSMEREQ